MDWFLYDNSLRHERVNVVHIFLSKCGELVTIPKGGSRTAATSKMQRFVIIVNGFQPLTITTKLSILDVAAVLDPPPLNNLTINIKRLKEELHAIYTRINNISTEHNYVTPASHLFTTSSVDPIYTELGRPRVARR